MQLFSTSISEIEKTGLEFIQRMAENRSGSIPAVILSGSTELRYVGCIGEIRAAVADEAGGSRTYRCDTQRSPSGQQKFAEA